jgi:hypothetical protein
VTVRIDYAEKTRYERPAEDRPFLALLALALLFAELAILFLVGG